MFSSTSARNQLETKEEISPKLNSKKVQELFHIHVLRLKFLWLNASNASILDHFLAADFNFLSASSAIDHGISQQ